MHKQKGFTIIEVLIVLVVVGIIGALIVAMVSAASNNGFEGSTAPQSTTPEQKPFTKTRCDFTGFQASSIINDEAGKGYRFTGRINTPLCGENGLSFELREQ